MATTNFLSNGNSLVSVSDPGQLIASLPPLLGFRPADSLVVLGIGGPTGKQLGPVVRLDLPPPEKDIDVLDTLMTVFRGHVIRAVALVVVGRHGSQRPSGTELPHADLIELLHAGFGDLGPEIEHALWTPEIRAGSIWACYEDSGCRGTLPDETTTPTAAAATVAGCVTYDSREELAAQLNPPDPAAVRRTSRLLATAIDEIDPCRDPEEVLSDHASAVRAALTAVKRSEAGDGRSPLDISDDQVVRLALALSHTQVRDACLAMALAPGEDTRRQAERLWFELVRRVPEPERTEPATLLAYSAYMRGEGALATIALDVALAANPKNALAGLLTQCLLRGIEPRKLRNLGQVEHLTELCRPPDTDKGGDV